MDSIPLILGVETATLAGSICLAKGQSMLGVVGGDATLSHSNSLLMDLDRILDHTNTTLEEIDLFTVAVGPGSFTGLRIGLATVKALANTLKRQCVGVSTLEAIAHAAAQSQLTAEAIVALLPAGRGELFVQAFSVLEDGSVSEIDRAAHLSPSRVFERYQNFSSLVWAGDGAQAFKELIVFQASEQRIHFAEAASAETSSWAIARPEPNLAIHVAALGYQRYLEGLVVDPETLSALYVRPSDAELKTNVINN